uniref:Ymf67 n=1 Tax=Tetrahymena rostrata TaxID=5909 RepID=A0A6G5NK95_TETRO|nr:Ymf67 [Tetrahymena rostrata]QBI37947.1 Ymf67 [Tetrahymena rostrata]URP31139.1 Ymf67 [Tetrahymena rostrata]
MSALLLHYIWLVLYIIFSIIFSVFVFLFYRKKKTDLSKYKNNYFSKIILIFFANKNLNLFKQYLTTSEINLIEIERSMNWPTLNFIHSNINKIDKNNKNIFDKKSFKNYYNTFKFLKENKINLNIENSENFLLNFSIIINILKLKYKKFYYLNILDLLVLLLIAKNSTSNKKFNISVFNTNYFNDYVNYIKLTNIDNTNKNSYLLVINSNTNHIINTKFKSTVIKSNKVFNNLNNFIYNTDSNKNFLINLNENFLNSLKKIFKISFSSSNITKYISNYTTNNSIILYLRKNKIFNKSRYSRNRQTYRTGAYWCLYVNIIAVIAFYFWFYKFTFNFGYVWWILYIFILSFFLPRALKYKFYNPIKILNEIKLSLIWLYTIFKNIINFNFKYLNLIATWMYKSILVKSNQLFFITKLARINKIDFIYIWQSFNFIKQTNNLIIFIWDKI